MVTDNDCDDDDELRDIVEWLHDAIDNDLGIIKTEDDVMARFKLAQAAFDTLSLGQATGVVMLHT